MEKIQANICFDVVFLYKNIRASLFTHVFLYFLHLVLTFTPPLHHNGVLVALEDFVELNVHRFTRVWPAVGLVLFLTCVRA